MSFDSDFANPPKEFSLSPFWFWNDELNADELLRQIDGFERNGVNGFVIHPRVGLPRSLGWMSDRLLEFYRLAIEEAERRGMKVILYDEGMYPSGSSCGQVVAKWPELMCRCLALQDESATLPAGAEVVETVRTDDGRLMHVVNRTVGAYIRGLHYIGEGPAEDEPPASDLLNPRTADAVIELVYQKFYDHFGRHFGKTILGIFTDEPNPLGKCRERDVRPGTHAIVGEVSRLLGYDFRPHLGALWSKDPATQKYRDDYSHAIRMRMEETWYAPLSRWCESHGVALCGHPDAGDEIGAQRFFQIPGQDLVWRWVLPDEKTALEGAESTQAKCSSSAMIHGNRRRNSNEFAGAYGAEATFDEIKWLAHWCLIRGVNLLIPHAFYYSVRGLRRDERPPQVGLHTPQWDDFGPSGFKAFADQCRQASWLNADSRHLCHVAILTHDDRCPWPAAAVIFKGQRDFNYVDPHTLLHDASVDASGIRIGSMHYQLLVIDGDYLIASEVLSKLQPMIAAGRVVQFGATSSVPSIARAESASSLIAAIDRTDDGALTITSDSDALRVRSLEKLGRRIVMVFNESLKRPLTATVRAKSGGETPWPTFPTSLTLQPGELRIFTS